MHAAGRSSDRGADSNMFALYQKGDETIQARRQLLVEQREQLIERIREMNETLERLNYKIDAYERNAECRP